MNLYVIFVFYVSIFWKGKKVIRKEIFLKKIFLFIFIDIFLVYFKKFDFDFKVIS